MSKPKSVPAGNSVLDGMFQLGVYKRTQGKITRQVTFAALAIGFVLAAYSLHNFLLANWSRIIDGLFSRSTADSLIGISDQISIHYLVPGLLVFFGLWLSYRIVNLTQFADFLIAVEAEMKKVSWPTWDELVKASIVVILMIFLLAILLFGYDVIWRALFQWLGILYVPPEKP